ncbi:MAG: sulfatase-like hydrolase/transferase [Faecalibacterium sp.]
MSRGAWENTFPVILRNHGYQTAWVGKNHVPVGEKSYKTGAMEQTFDYWYGNHGHSKFYPKETAGSGGIYDNAKADTQIEIFEEGAMNFLDPQPEFIASCTAPLIYRDKSKPFCMCVTFNLPHDCSTETME